MRRMIEGKCQEKEVCGCETSGTNLLNYLVVNNFTNLYFWELRWPAIGHGVRSSFEYSSFE